MKKIKKLLAMIMAMTMVLGMAMTVSAAPVTGITSDITVKGLSQGVPTDVKMYQFASLQHDEETNEYSWEIAPWAIRFVGLNSTGTAYEIINESGLKNAAEAQVPTAQKDDVLGTECVFEGVEIGAYVIIPSDENADYLPLFVANTYDRESSPSNDGKPVAINVIAYAKSQSHTITKEEDDKFAQIGQRVNYTIHATFPMSTNSDGEELTSFVITDEPTGLLIDDSTVQVRLAGEDVTAQIIHSVDGFTGVLTVNFANLIAGGHDGKDITITYAATVTNVEYNNNASATSDTTEYKPGTVEGKTGSITITKKDAETQDVLSGVTFKVYDLGPDGVWDPSSEGEPMELIFDADMRAYRPVLSTDREDSVNAGGIVTEITDRGGLVRIVGLDEGNYHFEEIVAPDGYSINEEGLTVTIADEEGMREVSADFPDTKLASLPSTGGIGTTIFTIGGCAIMIAAAALYFVNRRKSEEN